MSTCTKWVDQIVITCKNWTSKLDHVCTSWADEGSKNCSKRADEGSKKCSKRADESSKKCTSWKKCHWYTPWNCIAGFFCRAYHWVAKWVCKAYHWVAKWVCKAYYWVSKWVCKAFAWVVKAICVVFSWALSLVCTAWDTLRCMSLKIIKGIVKLFHKDRSHPKIEHVFVLMLENRSFDHMLGFSGLTGIDINGNPATLEGSDTTRDKNYNPVNNSKVTVSAPADFQLKDIDKDPSHEFESVVTQLCGKDAVYNPVPGGYPSINNSGFIQNYKDSGSSTPERIMECFSPDQLPVMNALAKEFAVCDHWFSSLPGPTWPNRFFLLAATSGGLDDSPEKLDIVSSITVEGYRFENGNIFDLLDNNCIPWRIFEGDEFPVSFAMKGMNLNALQGRFKDFEDFENEVSDSDFKEKFIFIEPKYGSHKFDIAGPGDYTCGNSMHPYDDVIRGESLIKRVYETIRNSPHWDKSMLLILFDEHGGFYDHVKPPKAVSPGDMVTESYVKNHFQFDQLGVRVPALVISPFTKKGVIDHTVYDHTSMLASVEKMFGMGNLTNRDKAANDFLHLFSLDSPRNDTPSILPEPATNPHPLPCEDDDELSSDKLLLHRSELRLVRSKGIYNDRKIENYKPSSSQIGFMQIALLRVLQDEKYSYQQKQKWISEYKSANTAIDVSIFITEAKLKLKYDIDLIAC